MKSALTWSDRSCKRSDPAAPISVEDSSTSTRNAGGPGIVSLRFGQHALSKSN